jgi:putative tryptophan/tyrosine transport system substrate-binding protein
VKRRTFITLLGGAAAWPHVARAQQRAKLPRIGFLGLVPEFIPGDGLRSCLRDLGYFEGSSIVIEWRWAKKVEELPYGHGAS